MARKEEQKIVKVQWLDYSACDAVRDGREAQLESVTGLIGIVCSQPTPGHHVSPPPGVSKINGKLQILRPLRVLSLQRMSP